ncbi:type I polyketide synthase [Mycobacterium sp. 050134]|uniref:type I polyketide synthase n=1 Tax=Mycobacterium sp. 050134 TaxID=3096111 RepID=UPI002EDB8619
MTPIATPIAVVGIDCRFPAAPDKEAFWRLLLDAAVTDTEVPAERWRVDAYYDRGGAPGTMNTRRGHFIDDVDAFDNQFFGIAPIEAAGLDPQQRLLLETSWRAIEDAGIDPRSLAGTQTGVFVGIMSSEWSSLQLNDFTGVTAFRGTGSGYFMAANRISYHLGLNGPSVAIDSACSSSLTAVHQGCAALRSGEADLVIAGGANLMLTPALSIFYTQAGLSAPDGRCKPFGEGADGIGRGEGVGAVVLRRLDDAVAAGQPIYAVVKSSVVNHDGRSNGITAPNRHTQVALMRRALDAADIDAADVDFVEAHGTGTVIGDAIEARALGELHRSRHETPCLLGSVKGNIGHTEGSAGIASFIKTCLALHHHALPPTVFGQEDHRGLRLGELGLQLADGKCQLPAEGAIGAVSSFGLGGSNAHVIVESAPAMPPPAAGRHGALTISGSSPESLSRNAAAIIPVLEALEPARLASWCRSTNVVKRSNRHRLAAHGDRNALLKDLRQFVAGTRPDLASSTPPRKTPASFGLLFSGQGTQYPAMTRPLYDANAVYRRNLESAAAAVNEHLRVDLLAELFERKAGLADAGIVQPALFAVSYSLAKTLRESGIEIAFGIGHSLGEISAACLAGVLTLADAARLVTARGRLMESLPHDGAMISVDLSPAEAEEVLDGETGCAVAAVNGEHALTISGPTESMERIHTLIRQRGRKATRLNVSQAFHSPSMRPIVEAFRRELSGLEPGDAEFPIFSTVLGRQVTGQEMDADYWAEQILAPVRFADAVRAALSWTVPAYLAEAGPKSVLLSLAGQSPVAFEARMLALCSGAESRGTELLEVAAATMRDGYAPALDALYGGPMGPALRLPPYVFDASNRYWLDRAATPSQRVSVIRTAGSAVSGESSSPEGDLVTAGIVDMIADVGGYPSGTLDLSKRLVEDLGYDSLLQLRLLERLRTQYPPLSDVNVAEVLPSIGSVGDLVGFVTQRLSLSGETG